MTSFTMVIIGESLLLGIYERNGHWLYDCHAPMVWLSGDNIYYESVLLIMVVVIIVIGWLLMENTVGMLPLVTIVIDGNSATSSARLPAVVAIV